MVEDSENIRNMRVTDPYVLLEEEKQWLNDQELNETLVEAVLDKFHDMFYSDDSRDIAEFWRLLEKYQGGNKDFRAGIDRAMVAIVGYRLISLMKMSTGLLEDQL